MIGNMASDNYIVSVVIVTYNQEQWIRQTIESILAQESSYPFEVIIGDDCSTDNTSSICQEYADKYDNVKLITHKQNQGVVGNWVACIGECTGKYLMNCAGDDYWHNPYKIQLQTDFMESNPNCVICHTDIDKLFVKNNKLVKAYNKINHIVPPSGFIQQDVLSGREKIAAVTICYRLEELKKYCPLDTYVSMRFPREDWPTILILAAYGEVCYIPTPTATYRVGQVSISNAVDYDKILKRAELDKQMTAFLYTMLPDFGPFEDAEWFDTYVYHSLLVAAYENNDYMSAKKFAKKDPMNGLLSKMAMTYMTFQVFRLYRLYKNR